MILRFESQDGAPGEIRTPDPLVRSQVLYPAELRARDFILFRRKEGWTRALLASRCARPNRLPCRFVEPSFQVRTPLSPAVILSFNFYKDKLAVNLRILSWRRERDSNPRWSY